MMFILQSTNNWKGVFTSGNEVVLVSQGPFLMISSLGSIPICTISLADTGDIQPSPDFFLREVVAKYHVIKVNEKEFLTDGDNSVSLQTEKFYHVLGKHCSGVWGKNDRVWNLSQQWPGNRNACHE